MRQRNTGQRMILAALSLLACGAVGAYIAFIGLDGHPEEVAASNGTAATASNLSVSAASADAKGGAETEPASSPATQISAGAAISQNAASKPDRPQLAQSEGGREDSSGKQFNDWTIRCQRNDAGEVLGCEAYQRLSVRDTGQRFLELAVGYPEGGETPLAIFVLPLGLWLPPGMDFQIDDGDPLKTPIQRCIQGGCLVQIPLSPELLSEMKQGQQLAIQVYRQKDDPIGVPISLIGFTAALEEIQP